MTILTNSTALDPALMAASAPARASTGRPATAPGGQQNFDATLGKAMDDGAGEGRKFLKMTENPYLKDMLVANGGFGLQAIMTSQGFLDGDATLRGLCEKLATIAAMPDDRSLGSGAMRAAGIPTGRRWSSSRGSGDPAASAALSKDLSSLSAKFESGELGAAAIGYDEVGGTSYGLYQIASGVGTMDNFLDYLDRKAPDIARRLRAAGPANTGSRGGQMPQVWRQIAAENPQRFGEIQRDFIRESHYDPAARSIQDQTGLDMNRQIPAIQEVLWSTAVQHGAAGAARIFTSAIDKVRSQPGRPLAEGLIEEVYARRAGQFGSSSARIQSAVRNRFQTERQLALLMAGLQQS